MNWAATLIYQITHDNSASYLRNNYLGMSLLFSIIA